MGMPRRAWTLAFAVALCAVYLAMATAAAIAYPGDFSPLHHWLSDLGNRRLNPAGSVWYRAASILGGGFMAGAFVALAPWRPSRGARRAAFLAMQGLGVVAGLGFTMTGVFPEDLYAIHRDWSRVLFAAFVLAAVASLVALPGKPWRRVALDAAIALCVVSGILYGLSGATWLEWTTVGGFLCFGLVLGFQTVRLPER